MLSISDKPVSTIACRFGLLRKKTKINCPPKGYGRNALIRERKQQSLRKLEANNRYGHAFILDINNSTGAQTTMPAVRDRRTGYFIPFANTPSGLLVIVEDTRPRPSIITDTTISIQSGGKIIDPSQPQNSGKAIEPEKKPTLIIPSEAGEHIDPQLDAELMKIARSTWLK